MYKDRYRNIYIYVLKYVCIKGAYRVTRIKAFCIMRNWQKKNPSISEIGWSIRSILFFDSNKFRIQSLKQRMPNWKSQAISQQVGNLMADPKNCNKGNKYIIPSDNIFFCSFFFLKEKKKNQIVYSAQIFLYVSLSLKLLDTISKEKFQRRLTLE